MDIAAARLSRDRAKILLVDGDAATRRSLQLLLQAEGFDVRAYANGVSLLTDPNCVSAACFVTDYQSDRTTGIDILNRLRERGWTGPAIMTTPIGMDEVTQRALATGFVSVLHKPLHHHALVEVIQRLVTQRNEPR